MAFNKLESRLIHASNVYPNWIGKTLLKGEIGFEELLDTLKISIDKTVIADKLWAIELKYNTDKIALLANFDKTDPTGSAWLSSESITYDEFYYIQSNESGDLNWDNILVGGLFLEEDAVILSSNNGYDVEIIFKNTTHPVETNAQNTKIVITEVTSHVKNDVNAEGVSAEYLHYQFINYRMKVGDGVRVYQDLPYFGNISIATGGGSTGGGTFTGIVYQSEITEYGSPTDNEIISSVTSTSTPHNGDLFVINRRINDQYTIEGDTPQVIQSHVEKTAYSYDGIEWIALDGNYDARNVIFHENITITKPFGIHTTVTSNKVLTAKGKSVYQFLAENLASEDTSVKKSGPRVTGSATAVYVKTTDTNPTTQVTFTASSTNPTYEYGIKSGDGTIGSFGDFKVTYDGTEKDMVNKSYTTVVTANPTHGHTKSYTVKAVYTEGTEKPLTNLGNVVESERYSTTTCTSTAAVYARYYTPLIAIKLDTQLTSGDLTASGLKFILEGETGSAVSLATGSYSNQVAYTTANQFNNVLPTIINGDNQSYKSIIIAIPKEYGKVLTGKKFAQDSKVPVGAAVIDVEVTVGSKEYYVTAFNNAANVSFEIIVS